MQEFPLFRIFSVEDKTKIKRGNKKGLFRFAGQHTDHIKKSQRPNKTALEGDLFWAMISPCSRRGAIPMPGSLTSFAILPRWSNQLARFMDKSREDGPRYGNWHPEWRIDTVHSPLAGIAGDWHLSWTRPGSLAWMGMDFHHSRSSGSYIVEPHRISTVGRAEDPPKGRETGGDRAHRQKD